MTRISLSLALLAVWASPAQSQLRTIKVDAGKVTGEIRSLQGVNLGPLHSQPDLPDLTKQYKDLRIDTIRTHDFFGPTDTDALSPKDRGAAQVIFRDWNADPENPESYQFGPSDRVIKGIADMGAEIYYRLGRSFSANPTPPPDFDKYANVCKHIVMHYNAGWDNGFHYNIRYWEVWNEPNIEKTWVPNKGLYLFWSGTAPEFLSLYEKIARTLKAYDSKLKIGTFGLAEGARESVYREGLIKHCAENKVPLDFFSWHHYHGDSSDPWDMVRIAKDVRRILDSNGLTHTESHVNEWGINLNKTKTGPQNQGSMEAAAFDSSALIYLLDAPLDRSYNYTGNAGNMGMFEPDGSYRKKAYAMKATGEMLATRQRLAATGGDTFGFAVLAGRSQDRRMVQVLVSNYQILIPDFPPRQSADPNAKGLDRRTDIVFVNNHGYDLTISNLPWKGPCTVKRYRTTATENWVLAAETETKGGPIRIKADLPPPGIELVVVSVGQVGNLRRVGNPPPLLNLQ